ncbi:MAG TPA: gephyrin-like molybdotransferase Glp [Patescibacteria group bacterium]|nr:gephyrin-like molybdotransferase Glp [Patescibacteria group bacterium]
MARLKGFQELVRVEDALEKWLAAIEFHPNSTSVPLLTAQNRVLSSHIIANTDLPRTDRSAVDGYAVKATETIGASQSKPKIFKLNERDAIGPNQAKQIWTGNTIPENADAVVMLENTKMVGKILEVWSPMTRWENVSRKGEDIKKGEIAVKTGTRLKPHHLGIIAAFGMSEVEVFQKPKVAVLATGNEIVRVGDRIRENKVFDSNRVVLTALCNELGAEVIDLGIARDDMEEISQKLNDGLRRADAVMTSGGTSVGGPDLVPEVAARIGKPGILVHGVAMRPGMPTGLAVVGKKPIILLPGNPVAVMLSFEVFGRPLISRMLGLQATESRPMLMARTKRKISTTLGRKNLVRVHVSREKGEFIADPISARGSSLFSTMTRSNGYVIVPETQEGLAEGAMVAVNMFEDLKVGEDDV